MPSTIDFSTMNDNDLIYGYQRVNRSRFPDNFVACTEELLKRGLHAPEKFEIEALTPDAAVSAFRKLGSSFTSLARAFSKRTPFEA